MWKRAEDRAGRKKGAHYSAHMRRLGISGLIAPCVLCALAAMAADAAHRHADRAPSTGDARQARAQLEAVRDQIAHIARQVSRGQAQRDRLTRQLQATEKSVGQAQAALDDLRQQRDAGATRRGELEAQKRQREAQLASSRKALAGQLRAAYLIGRQEPLKLLLNQGDPAQAGRMFVYYSYFGRARALEIQAIEADLQRIGQLDAQLQVEDAKLAGLQQEDRKSVV